MAFVKFVIKKSRKLIEGLSLSSTGISINRDCLRRLGNPQIISVFYDTESNAIKIIPDSEGRKLQHSGNSNPFIMIPLSKIMPKGRYKEIEPGIFELIPKE